MKLLRELKYRIIIPLWKIRYIYRRWCWADAVMWAEFGGGEIGRADHKCFYCNACNTRDEIEAHEAELLKDGEE